eukprot:15348993-Ditylum_brightwellii.AAC.1
MHNGNPIQPLSADEILDILEYRVPAKWRREFTVQGFDLVDQGFKGKPKGGKPSKLRTAGKHKVEVLTTPTTQAGKKVYCKMHGRNRTHNTKDCLELKWRAKQAKPGTNRDKVDKVSYKDLNALVNAKVTTALNKAKKI